MMEAQLPNGLTWKEQGRLAWCSCCRAVVACSNEKLLKQHLKSRTHKKSYIEASKNTQQREQPVTISDQHPASVSIVPPEDYQAYHLEALHIAGSYPDDSPYPGFYYTFSTCLQTERSNKIHGSSSKGSSQVNDPHTQQVDYDNAGHHQPQQLPGKRCSKTVEHPSSVPQAMQQLQRCLLTPGDSNSTVVCPPSFCHNLSLVQPIDDVTQQQPHELQQAIGPPEGQQPCRTEDCSSRPCWPLPCALKPKAALAAGTPFLTPMSGSIPWVPDNLEEALAHYCQPGACRLPNIDIQGVNQQVKSWSHAAKLLRAAAAGSHVSNPEMPPTCPPANILSAQNSSCAGAHGGQSDGVPDTQDKHRQQEQARRGPAPYWASLVVDITHPAWWPKTGHVPTYDVVIIGAGVSGIGIHRDVDHSVCRNLPPVSTYLTIARGKKHVIIMPPHQTLFPIDDRIPFPVAPSLKLLQAIKAAGGAYFDLQPAPDGSPVTLYMPAGWLHWLVGAADWHVVFGGSIKRHGSL